MTRGAPGLVEVMAVRTWLEATAVADGVFRVRSKRVNCYLIRDGSALTLVDTGLPGHWPAIKTACATLGLDLPAIEAVLLTHVHTDHAGSAERARTEASVRGHEKVPACGQVEVPAFGRLEVPIPRSSCRPGG